VRRMHPNPTPGRPRRATRRRERPAPRAPRARTPEPDPSTAASPYKRTRKGRRTAHWDEKATQPCYLTHMSFGEVKELLQTGGITMVIIVLSSIAAVVIGIERFLFLR